MPTFFRKKANNTAFVNYFVEICKPFQYIFPANELTLKLSWNDDGVWFLMECINSETKMVRWIQGVEFQSSRQFIQFLKNYVYLLVFQHKARQWVADADKRLHKKMFRHVLKHIRLLPEIGIDYLDAYHDFLQRK